MNQQVPEASVAAAAGNRVKVFVSYSRKDLAFAQMMVDALAERGFDAFLDKKDIAPGEPWQERLAGLIATADTVVFSVSPDTVASPICASPNAGSTADRSTPTHQPTCTRISSGRAGGRRPQCHCRFRQAFADR